MLLAVPAIVMACLGASTIPGVMPGAEEKVIVSFAREELPANLKQNNARAELTKQDGKPGIRVDFSAVDWPNITFQGPEGGWDWSAYQGIAVDVYNPGDKGESVCMRIDNKGANGMDNCTNGKTQVQPGEWATFYTRFDPSDVGPYWGMRGNPITGPVSTGGGIDPSKITAFQIFLTRPVDKCTLVLGDFRLVGRGSGSPKTLAFPFIDRFGQYMHADWPGKVHSEDELARFRAEEENALNKVSQLPGRDRFGGWAEGPQLKATGWFRTEQVDGKWWLVTPEGRLFFSAGIDCVGTWASTFVEKRDTWFEWLPEKDDPRFGQHYHRAKGAHSGADIIGGEGQTYSFYSANLARKYGEEWRELWRQSSYARLRGWGFNTIANWSQRDVLENSLVPFVASAGISGDVRRIEGGGGYWAKMIDVYDERFPELVEQRIAAATKPFAKNPLCIGYFVDNEVAWEAVERGPLASPPGQPCRIAMVERLKAKYKTLEALNKAWGTTAADWDSLRVSEKANAACQADLDENAHLFARKYFETIKAALRRHAPNQLYLGCRFASAPEQAVKACAEVVDVVSFNKYRHSIKCEDYSGAKDLGAPIIIGEFHFGALDRGMFHTGLVAARDQQERAENYARYVRSVLDCPAYVGCHWFQYVDEPTTGRWFDGENYNIGFVTITDTPYPEMVAAAKGVHAEMYERRFKGKGKD